MQSQFGNPALGQSEAHPQQISQSSTGQARPSWTRFVIPTKTTSLDSGFPFHPQLYDLRVTHDEWHRFSGDIVKACKLSTTDNVAAWSTGIVAGILGSALVVTGPVVGYYSWKSIHNKKLHKKVNNKLLQEGDLRLILERWNNQTFVHKGFQAWLELPKHTEELIEDKDVNEAVKGNAKKQKKAAKMVAQRFRILIIPLDNAPFTSRQATRSDLSNSMSPPISPMDESLPPYSDSEGKAGGVAVSSFVPTQPSELDSGHVLVQSRYH